MCSTDDRKSWWVEERTRLLKLAEPHESCYVYNEAEIEKAAKAALSLPVERLFYAIKANSHPDVLRTLRRCSNSIGFECVSIYELEFVAELFANQDSGDPPVSLLFTPNFAPRKEYAAAFALPEKHSHIRVFVTVDCLHPFSRWGPDFRGQDVFLRIDTGNPDGHHAKVKTAGLQSKFGIAPSALPGLLPSLALHDIRVVGLHTHVGSGIRRPETWSENAALLIKLCSQFPDLRYLDIGGGLSVPDNPQDPSRASPLDMSLVASALSGFRSSHADLASRYELWMEPGRYLVAEAGVLLSKVTQLKEKGGKRFIGISTGFNSLIRPALYNAYHHIVNLSRLDSQRPVILADVVGPICETGDVLGVDRSFPDDTDENDVLLLATAGAYGHVMSSRYNMREPAIEIFFKK